MRLIFIGFESVISLRSFCHGVDYVSDVWRDPGYLDTGFVLLSDGMKRLRELPLLEKRFLFCSQDLLLLSIVWICLLKQLSIFGRMDLR